MSTSALLYPDVFENASLQYTIGKSTICAFANKKLESEEEKLYFEVNVINLGRGEG